MHLETSTNLPEPVIDKKQVICPLCHYPLDIEHDELSETHMTIYYSCNDCGYEYVKSVYG